MRLSRTRKSGLAYQFIRLSTPRGQRAPVSSCLIQQLIDNFIVCFILQFINEKIIHAHHTCIYEWAVSRFLKSRSPNLSRPYIIKIGTLIFIISGMEIWRRNEMKNGLAVHFQFIHQSKSCLFKRRALFVLEPRCWARDKNFPRDLPITKVTE